LTPYFDWLFFAKPIPGLPASDSPDGRDLWMNRAG
jgi:hypothetical protein